MYYNIDKQVINYDEQTKSLAGTKYEVDDREELAKRTYEGAVSLRQMLEEKWIFVLKSCEIKQIFSKN